MRTCRLIFIVLILFLAAFPLQSQDRLYANMFPAADIELLDPDFLHARDLNIHTLLQYDADRLMAPFFKEAGLAPRDSSYTNWEGLDGHIGGHYLTALAMNLASTHHPQLARRLDSMIQAFSLIQASHQKNHPGWGDGYIGGVPQSAVIWPALEKGDLEPYRKAWVPWYNLHKLYAGLRDVWIYTGNIEARRLFLDFCDWAIRLTQNLTEKQMQAMLDTEHGGMNEIFADAYQLTGERRYLDAAHRFSHRQLLDPMAEGRDLLDNKHANTQVPKAIGFARIGELSGEPEYRKAGSFFWETVTHNRSLAFGGNSRREHFPAAQAGMDFIYEVEGPESCNSYNMLKLTADLFREEPLAKYMDYYERTLYNHILSTQHPEHGGYVYFTPVRPRSYRVYSTPNQAMWCCVGSGMENHGKYQELVYTHTGDSLYVNLFIASRLTWNEKGIRIRQTTRFPEEEKTALEFLEANRAFTLLIRYPSWVKAGTLRITINGKIIPLSATPSSYISINRYWKKGDRIDLSLPMQNTLEPLNNVPDYIALLHGPIVLAAPTGTEDLKGLQADGSRWGHIASGKKLPVDQAPILIADELSAIPRSLKPVKGKPLHFRFEHLKMINSGKLELQPFAQIHDARYMIYWMALSPTQYRSHLDSIATAEKERLALENRTIDQVAPGEQQPEADHDMRSEKSRSGNASGAFWRDASDGGSFSYRFLTGGKTNLILRVRYWGAEWGNRKFDIYVDDEKLATEDNSGRWNQSRFFEVEYIIPPHLLEGKTTARIKFQSFPGSTAGGVYFIRLAEPE